jgi:hypothetical protein
MDTLVVIAHSVLLSARPVSSLAIGAANIREHAHLFAEPRVLGILVTRLVHRRTLNVFVS